MPTFKSFPRSRALPLTASSLILLALLTMAPAAHARGTTTMSIVTHYDKTENAAAAFKGKTPFNVPAELIDTVTIPTPSRAYSAEFTDVFLQNDRMVVCYKDCSLEQPFKPRLNAASGDFFQDFKSAEKASKKNYELDGEALRMATTYYWVDQVLSRFEQIGHKFSHRLIVRVDADVKDLETGAPLTNNAFFMDTQVGDVSWSLTFLPEDTGLIARLLTGGKRLRKASLDPSVAMHEATHFVFQESIGPILNSEVFGLHEAFADYFSLAVLNTSDIGRVMFAGTPIRTAKDLLKYTPGMEAHDLGNVVVAALWNIRQMYSPELYDVVDAAAYETVRTLSLNPYAEAGDVVQAHLTQLKFALGPVLAQDDFEKAIDAASKVWAATELPVHEVPIDTAVIRAPLTQEELASAVTFTTWMQVPALGTTFWGQKPVQKYMVSVLARRPGPKTDSDEYQWIDVAIQNMDDDVEHGPAVATPIWVLVSKNTGGLRSAYSAITGTKIDRDSADMLKTVFQVGQVMSDVNDYALGFGGDVAALLSRGSILNVKAKKIRLDDSRAFSIGFGDEQRFLPLTEFEINVRPTFVGWLLGLVGEKSAKSIKAVRVYGVPAELLDDARLPDLPGGLKMVGYEVERKTGVKTAVRLEDLTVQSKKLINTAKVTIAPAEKTGSQ